VRSARGQINSQKNDGKLIEQEPKSSPGGGGVPARERARNALAFGGDRYTIVGASAAL
jgi:hypothetical protein